MSLLIGYIQLYNCFHSCPYCRVAENMPLYDILNEFQKGHSHIAVVYKDLNSKEGEQFKDSCKKKGKLENSSEKGEDTCNKWRCSYLSFSQHFCLVFLHFCSLVSYFSL